MSEQTTGIGMKLKLSGVLVYRDEAGNVLKEVPFDGDLPLSALGLSEEQEQALINAQE